MQWYYANQGKQAGPVDDAGLDNLIRQGAVQPHTLVWREGMAQWQQLSLARPSSPPAAPAPQSATPAPAPVSAPAPAPAPQAMAPQPVAPRPAPSPTPMSAPQPYTPQPPASQPMAPSPMQPQQPYSQPQFGQVPSQQGYGQPQQPQYGQPQAPGYGQPSPPQQAPRPQSSFEQTGFGQPKQAGASDFGAPLAGAVAGGVAGAMGAMGQSSSQTITCVNCGQLFPSSAAVMIGSSWVCGNCKPVYMQRMREGGMGATTGGMRLAGFWIRFGAYLIDSIICSIALMIIVIPISMVAAGMMASATPGEINPAAFGLFGLLYLIEFAALAGYQGYFLSKKGATPGKQVLGLKVIRSNGGPITMGRGIGRFFAYMISSMPLALGFIMIGFDKEKRGLHDMICDTRVVTTR